MFGLRILVAVFLFALLFAFIQVGLLSIAFDKLGLSMGSAMLLLLLSLIGSGINVPLFTMASAPPADARWDLRGWSPLHRLMASQPGRTLVTLNVGGGLIPVAFSIYLLAWHPLPPLQVVLAIAIVAAVCYAASRPIPRLGIGMPILLAPITAALTAIVLSPGDSAPLAYICGTLGVLIGADLLHMRDIRRLGTPFASIGGAGTFDGVFITGIVAVLLA
ncbi:MAG TPA: DUF1614 domain-containing protein [Gammaproteobacteria bacterium]|nr:DUF1614 domain-containing protein [Gammaproteobacteria bacterium]